MFSTDNFSKTKVSKFSYLFQPYESSQIQPMSVGCGHSSFVIYPYGNISRRQICGRNDYPELNLDDLVQDSSISSLLAMEILQSCTKPLWEIC